MAMPASTGRSAWAGLYDSSHMVKAATMPTAPWARLNTPVVEYVTTTPEAETASPPPITIPIRV